MPYCHRTSIPVLSDPRKVWSDLSSHFSRREYWLNGILSKLLKVAKNQCLLLQGRNYKVGNRGIVFSGLSYNNKVAC